MAESSLEWALLAERCRLPRLQAKCEAWLAGNFNALKGNLQVWAACMTTVTSSYSQLPLQGAESSLQDHAHALHWRASCVHTCRGFACWD